MAARPFGCVQGGPAPRPATATRCDAALAWQDDGAEWIHLVDLDAAFGTGDNRAQLADIVGRLDVDVELSGGIRDDDSLAAALATGCARVNLGTAALEHPDWCARVIGEFGDRVAVGLDVRIDDGEHRLAARGWTEDGGDLWEVLDRLERDGCARYVVTDVTQGRHAAAARTSRCCGTSCARSKAPVVASGGVSSLADVAALAGLADVGVEGTIIGKALYARAFTLPEALAVSRRG